jgi:hypothetical protein
LTAFGDSATVPQAIASLSSREREDFFKIRHRRKRLSGAREAPRAEARARVHSVVAEQA